MKKLSFWAKNNRKKAIIIIVFSHFFLAGIAIVGGLWAFANDYFISHKMMMFLTIVFGLSIFFYPIKGQQRGWLKYSYLRQKSMDFCMTFSYLLLILSFTNQKAFELVENLNYMTASAQFIVHKVKPNHSASKKTLRQQLKKARKVLKAKLKVLKKTVQTSKDNSVEKGALTLLIILAACLFLYFIVVFSCNLMCNGQAQAAFTVLIGGSALVIALAVLAIRRLLISEKTSVETQ